MYINICIYKYIHVHILLPTGTSSEAINCHPSPPPNPLEDDVVGAAVSGSTAGVASSSASLDRVGI